MQRLLALLVLACLAAPAAAWALRRAPGDGTLAVRNGAGTVQLTLRSGAVLGKVQAGQVTVVVPAVVGLTPAETCAALGVWGADRESAAPDEERGPEPAVACRFVEHALRGTPEAIRLRLEGPALLVVRRGRGIWLSAVGQGRGFLVGAGGADGTYSLNGGPFQSLPDEGERFLLRAATLP